MPEGQTRTPEIPIAVPPETGPVNVEIPAERPAPVAERNPASVGGPPMAVPIVPVQPAATPVVAGAVLTKRVEDIMVAGLEETYQQLDPVTQARFKAEGERTAATISLLLQSTKVKIKQVIELLVGWLRILPGVNHFFLEQEAKIKADTLLALTKNPPA